MCFTLHPESRNSDASQSSNSGWLYLSPCVPKSSEVATSPFPKYSCQIRLTATCAVKGFCSEKSHLASPSLVGCCFFAFGRTTGVDGNTSIPGRSQLPRTRRNVGSGSGFSVTTLASLSWGYCRFNSLISFRASAKPSSRPVRPRATPCR